MSSVFSKIIKGEIPCFKIAEDENNLAFLDINPLKKGHTLVIPKMEVDQLFDLSDEDYVSLLQFSKRIANSIKATIPCKRVSVVVLGFEVPHAHIHLIPTDSDREIQFTNPKMRFSQEEMIEIADSIGRNMK